MMKRRYIKLGKVVRILQHYYVFSLESLIINKILPILIFYIQLFDGFHAIYISGYGNYRNMRVLG